MPLDLTTLLLVRMGVDALIALAFWAQMRRYPAINGPGWWALASLAGIAGAAGIWLRHHGVGPWAVSLASAVWSMGLLASWMGLRSHLGLTCPLGRLLATSVALLALNLLYAVGGDWTGARQLTFSLFGLFVAVMAVHDIGLADPRRRVPELRALRLLLLLEIAALVVLAVGLMASGLAVQTVSVGFLLFFLLTKLMRVVLYGALVALRLRLDGDQARQRLLVRETESRELIDNLSAGVMVFRPDQTLVTVNAAARCFLGWGEGGANPSVALPLSPGWRLLREDGSPMRRHEVPFERVLATGQPVSNVVLGVQTATDAAVRWALCNAYSQNDSLGGLRHVVFTFVDITSLKLAQQQQQALEQQLAQSQKMEALGTLAGGVAHDFNNILAAILGNADLARQDVPSDTPARESLHEISNAARRGRELVRQILAFSRQQPLSRSPVSLDAIVNETCSLLRTAITPQIQLVARIDHACPPLRADPTQLGQVLLNLGTNAIHALEDRPGRIEYRVEALARDDSRLPAEVAQACCRAQVDALRVLVSDDGAGMNEATRKRIFEPFFTTKAVGRGTGLGLPVVLGIVQAHGGAIEVDSAPGQGTRFWLYFPAATAMAAAPAPSAATAGTMGAPAATPVAPTGTAPEEPPPMAEDLSAAPRHVLYLDDDDTLVFLVRRLLERRGYRVTAFTNQQDAIRAVREQPTAFDLLMTDYNMPGMSGLDVAREVLALSPRLPVAVASGYITDDLQTRALAAGVREVVFKTDAVEAFCDVVARLVRPAPAA